MRLKASLCVLALPLFFFTSNAAFAQYKVLHDFTSGSDGAYPRGGLTIDTAGNLYGSTDQGGNTGASCTDRGNIGCGTVFEVLPTGALVTLYTFTGGTDGAHGDGRPVFGPDGSLYGHTSGGGASGFGNVYKMTPTRLCITIACPQIHLVWKQTPIYQFPDGQRITFFGPSADLVFNASGNVYGAKFNGGLQNSGVCNFGDCGYVYKLTHTGDSWSESDVYKFTGNSDGFGPSGLTLRPDGSLYGVTIYGGDSNCLPPLGCGTVFHLTPAGNTWTATTLHIFEDDAAGTQPWGSPVFDADGNFYATTTNLDVGCCATVYKLTPSGNTWSFSTEATLQGRPGPFAGTTMDKAGNLYGTTFGGGLGCGNVFKLTPSDHGWIYQDLHDFADGIFCNGGQDGAFPSSEVTIDAKGNLYGTTGQGGKFGYGTVWKIAAR